MSGQRPIRVGFPQNTSDSCLKAVNIIPPLFPKTCRPLNRWMFCILRKEGVDDHWQKRLSVLKRLQYGQSVHIGHVQIQDEEFRRRINIGHSQHLSAILGGLDAVALCHQFAAQKVPNAGVTVRDQYCELVRHGMYLFSHLRVIKATDVPRQMMTGNKSKWMKIQTIIETWVGLRDPLESMSVRIFYRL